MTERVIYILQDPQYTGHEFKWQTLCGGTNPDWWIDSQRETMDYLETKRGELSREKFLEFLRWQNYKHKEIGEGEIVVWLGDKYSPERQEIQAIESKLAKSISRQLKGLPSEDALLTKPSDEVATQMAKAAMAVYLSAINHPVIHDIHLGKG